MNLKKYKTIIFDCDGVVLNSNNIKTEAFESVFSSYKIDLVKDFISYHRANGGISRFEKIKFFLSDLAPQYGYFNEISNYEKLLERYSSICKAALYKSEVAKDLKDFRNYTNQTVWLIISGGDQNELRDVFHFKKIDRYFNGGIFGSPEKKIEIIKREIANGNIKKPALFLGDSKLDYLAASSNLLDFIFLFEWTDFYDYKNYCNKNKIAYLKNISSLIC